MRPELRNTVAVVALLAWLGGAGVVVVTSSGILGSPSIAVGIVAVALGAVGFGFLGAKLVEHGDAKAGDELDAVVARAARIEARLRFTERSLAEE